jgi:hypothetical protein
MTVKIKRVDKSGFFCCILSLTGSVLEDRTLRARVKVKVMTLDHLKCTSERCWNKIIIRGFEMDEHNTQLS